mmetsp:Transcript_37253/g.83272  ORF Transcript_37253/g.83272 Transcript_37253/m.83272 type:complete len:235 (+) Transcript_37253:1028-1732(+)
MADLAFGVVFLAARRGVTAAYDGGGAPLGSRYDVIHESFRSGFKTLHLENTHGAIPYYSFGLLDSLFVQGLAFASAIQAHEAIWNALILCHGLDLPILAKFARDDKVNGQNKLHTFLLCLLNDLWHNLCTLLVEEGIADGHSVVDLQEGVGHAASNDHHVHLVQHVRNQLNLVADLGATQNSQKRPSRLVQYLAKRCELLAHEESGHFDVEPLTNHAAVCSMCSAKRIIHIDIT